MEHKFQQYLYLLKITFIDPRLAILVRKIKKSNYTFLGYPRLYSLITSFILAAGRKNAPLYVAEFGVGRGGSAMILAWLIDRFGGSMALFDVFGRIPPPTSDDGNDAQIRYQKISQDESSDYYGNLGDLISTIRNELYTICKPNQVTFVQGIFEDTLPNYQPQSGYDLIHIDCDWYESTRTVLNHIQHNLSDVALIQIDDYEYWSGATKAVNEASWLTDYKRQIIEGALVIDMGLDKIT